MVGLRPPQKDIGPARAPYWSGIAVLAVLAVLVLAYALLGRLGLDLDGTLQGVVMAGLAATALAAILSPARRPADYYAADREVAPVASGLAGAAGFAGLLLIGVLNGGFASGGATVLAAAGLLCGFVLTSVLIAPALGGRPGLSVGDLLQARFGLPARLACATIGFAASLIILAAILRTAGAAIAASLGLSAEHGLLAATAVAILAVLPGGMRSLVASQGVQYILVAAGCLVPAAYLAFAGGTGPAESDAMAGLQNLLSQMSALFAASGAGGTLLPLMLMAVGTAALPQVAMLGRASASAREAAASYVWIVILALLLLTGALVLGQVTSGPADPIAQLIEGSPLSTGLLPETLSLLQAGLLITGILAGLLAAGQGALFAAASAVSRDGLDELVNRNGPAGGRIFAARLLVVVVAGAAAWLSAHLAMDASRLFGWALALSAAGLFLPTLLACRGPRRPPSGVAIGSIAGAGLVGVLFLVDLGAGGGPAARFGSVTAATLGLAAALVVTFVASLALAPLRFRRRESDGAAAADAARTRAPAPLRERSA